jgi:hypothetical protein
VILTLSSLAMASENKRVILLKQGILLVKLDFFTFSSSQPSSFNFLSFPLYTFNETARFFKIDIDYRGCH